MKKGFHWKRIVLILLICCGAPLCFFSSKSTAFAHLPCDYLMCQYEKENIDAIILSRARESQTVMFGEIHDRVFAEDPPPVEDSLYVIYSGTFKPLGYHLDHYTKGHNFSVYMGHPWDTPAGCDLFISHFIWGIY